MSALGKVVRQRREELGLSQRDLAQRASVTHTYISYVERGHTDNPTIKTLEIMATALDMTLEELLFAAGIARFGGDGVMIPRRDTMEGLSPEDRRLAHQMIDRLRRPLV